MTSAEPSPRASKLVVFARVLWALALVALVLRRPFLFGASTEMLARFVPYLALYVVLPGVLAYRSLRRSDDWLFQLGMGWTIGFVLQAIVYVALKMARLDEHFGWFPLVNVPLAWIAWRARGADGARPTEIAERPHVGWPSALALLALVALAIERQNLYPIQPLHWLPHLDLLFHAGNAAELANHFPLFDPRFAGDRLTYHFFSYAFAAGAHQVAKIPAIDFLGCVGAPALIALLAIQVFNAGRAFSGCAIGGLFAAALVMFQADFGHDPSSFRSPFNNLFVHGVYNSVTTISGLIVLTAIAIELLRWFDTERLPRFAVATLLVLGFAASGMKGSVMPVVVAGVLAALAHAAWRRSESRRRAALAFVVLALSSLPMTAYLSLAPGSYASSMFHWAPAVVVKTSSACLWIAERLGYAAGDVPSWLPFAVTPLWIAGYFGLIGFAVLRTRGAVEWTVPRVALLGMTAAAVAVAWALPAPGQSQLFFLYNGQLGLAILAASSSVLRRPKSAAQIACAAVAVALAFPLVQGTLRDAAAQWSRDQVAREPRPPASRAALDEITWIRENTPKDAVIVRKKPDLLLSAFAERRCYYESELHRPAHHDWGWKKSGGSPYVVNEPSPVGVEREALQRRFVEQPNAEKLRELRAAIGSDAPIYVLYDQLEGRYNARRQIFVAARPLETGPPPSSDGLLELVRESRVARVYRVVSR